MKYHHILLLAFGIFLVASYFLGYTPVAFGLLFLIVSLKAYFLYAKDKAAAKVGSWRVPENALHIVALLFGWPGALIAQERLRHKTKKQSFRVFFWLTVLVNLGGVAWLHSPQGNNLLREGVHQFENFAVSNLPHGVSDSTVLFFTDFRTKGVG